MANKSNWKGRERQIAAYFGCHRVPGSGAYPNTTSADCDHLDLYIECKQRKKWSIITLWDAVRHKARDETKIPVLAITEKGRPGFWILCHSGDLQGIANQRTRAKREG